MLLDLRFCMTLHDKGGFNQMLLQLCFCMTLRDERGGGLKSHQMRLAHGFCMLCL